MPGFAVEDDADCIDGSGQVPMNALVLGYVGIIVAFHAASQPAAENTIGISRPTTI